MAEDSGDTTLLNTTTTPAGGADGGGNGSGEGGSRQGGAAPAAAAAPAPVEQPAATTGQPGEGNWRDDLPEELKGSPALAKYASRDAALKALVNAQALIGKKAEGLVPPAKDAPEAEKQAFAAKLRKLAGVPDKAEDYELPKVDGLPDGLPDVPEATAKAFKAKALELGLSPNQLAGLYSWYRNDVEGAAYVENRAAGDKAAENGLAVLRKEYGAKTKDVLNDAAFAVKNLGLNAADFGPAANNPKVAKALAGLAPAFREGGLKGRGAGVPNLTPAEARAKGRAMMRDPRYSDPIKRDPAFVAQVERFYGDHFPGEQASPTNLE